MRWLSPPDSVRRVARQRQVFEPDIDQEAEPLVDLLQDARGDLALLRRQRLRPAPRTSAAASSIDSSRDLADVQPVDLDRQRLGLQAAAVAGLAGLAVLVAASSSRTQALSVSRQRRSMLGIDALERLGRLVAAQAVVVAHA